MFTASQLVNCVLYTLLSFCRHSEKGWSNGKEKSQWKGSKGLLPSEFQQLLSENKQLLCPFLVRVERQITVSFLLMFCQFEYHFDAETQIYQFLLWEVKSVMMQRSDFGHSYLGKKKYSLMIDKCILLATAKKRLTCTNNKKAMLVTMGLKTKHPVTALVGKLANNVPFLW